ncbi:MAG: macrolide ABC transporter permease/ATP-binding protein MacB, partial [Gammaproteobacteria bacterium]|nr:macrolide ABC transporter permease/ATP-binding protein MacB [Gammaproteobacteria bacterium]
LANGPNLLLADEPTGSLDSQSAKVIMGLLRTVHQQGITVILITHDARVAEMMNRTITLYDGRVVSDGVRSMDAGGSGPSVAAKMVAAR